MKTNVTVLALALGIASLQSAPAQTFKNVKVNGNAPLVQVASGGTSVWALASNGNPYIFNGKSFALANTISLSQIAVGGGHAAQADAVWALNSSGSIYHATKNGLSWVFSQVPGALDLIAVGPGYRDLSLQLLHQPVRTGAWIPLRHTRGRRRHMGSRVRP